MILNTPYKSIQLQLFHYEHTEINLAKKSLQGVLIVGLMQMLLTTLVYKILNNF
jgi:hypothetical protein